MSLYRTTFYSSETTHLFSDPYFIVSMLKAESALAQAQAKNEVIPASAAKTISEVCGMIHRINLDQLIQEIPLGGNAAIPLVKQLTSAVKAADPDAAKYVHLGVTSQDIIDTASMLIIKEYITWLESKLKSIILVLIDLTQRHRHSLMTGRTLLQHAKPITFGLKTAYWLDSMCSLFKKINFIKPGLLKIQLGGAVGTGNHFIGKNIRKDFSEMLELQDSIPWHTNRSTITEWASYLGQLSGHLGKIAKDISLLMQTEVAEVFEGSASGKGGSSTMPHKRNPVTCTTILANASRTPHLVAALYACMIQEHERSAGMWHAEWEPMAELMQLTAGSLHQTLSLLQYLEVDTTKMIENLEITLGLIYSENIVLALSPAIGKEKAQDLLYAATQKVLNTKMHLKKILEQGYASNVKTLDLPSLFDPHQSLGNSSEIIDEILLNAREII